MKVKEESEKVDLQLNIQKTKIMASWQQNTNTLLVSVLVDTVLSIIYT